MSLEKLDKYQSCGHNRLMGLVADDWQATDEALAIFGNRLNMGRRKYRELMQKEISEGKRPDLAGGGLVRSAGG